MSLLTRNAKPVNLKQFAINLIIIIVFYIKEKKESIINIIIIILGTIGIAIPLIIITLMFAEFTSNILKPYRDYLTIPLLCIAVGTCVYCMIIDLKEEHNKIRRIERN